MKAREKRNMFRTTIVCVDSCENGVFTGRFYNPYVEEGEAFGGVMQFLQKMEKILDEMGFPQSYTATRSFLSAAPVGEEPVWDSFRTGSAATFALKVMFRQNASWQGSLVWLEGRREESFRSVLEMLLLMDSALGAR